MSQLRQCERLCLFCEQFYFSTGYPDLSDVTPGEDMDIHCRKGHWKIEVHSSRIDFRRALETAQTCKDWEFIELPPKLSWE